MTSRVRSLVAGYPELITVLAAAAIGLVIQSPLAWLAGHQGINTLLAVLVFATAVTISPSALRRVAPEWRSLAVALLAGVTVLPLLSWAVAHVAPAGPLRDGLVTVGLAPCEIASVATTAMAGGEAALSAGVLIGSTLATVLLAGPALRLLAGPGASGASPAGIIVNLAAVIAAPLAAGLLVRWRLPARAASRVDRPAGLVALGAVAALVALIAAEVHLSARYASVGLALVAFLAGSGCLGWLLGLRSGRPVRAALLLTTSMRDFAIAAGLAVAAFGASAAAPLGLYGVLVLVWGTAAAGYLRRGGAGRQDGRGGGNLARARKPQGEEDGEGGEPGRPPERNVERVGEGGRPRRDGALKDHGEDRGAE
jgi:predicted Na+-dependent transporter